MSMKQTKEQFVGVTYDELLAENAKLREEIKKSEERRERQADNLINKCHTIARLQTENAKLRKQSERLFDKTLELASENSKLRELCKLCEREAENAKLHERICNLEAESVKLRQMVARMWPMATGTKRCTFADRLKLRAEIDELGIEVSE